MFAIGQTTTSPGYIDTLSAQVQARVGEFLALKAQILKIRDATSNPSTQAEAETLYAQQVSAEDAVKAALAAIDQVKTSGVSLDSISTITSGITQMEYQISQVKNLQSDYNKEIGKGGMFALSDWLTPMNLAIVGIGAFFLTRRR